MQVEWGAPLPDLLPEQGPKIAHESVKKLEIHHGQHLCKTWQDFFAHHEAKNALRWEKESEQSQQAWLQREEHACQFRMPGSKDALVFAWTWDEDKGYLVRKHVVHSQVEGVWGEYQDTQHQYDGFHDKWDLNWEFDPNARDDSKDYENDADLAEELYGDLDSAITQLTASLDCVDEAEGQNRNANQDLDWEELGRRLSRCNVATKKAKNCLRALSCRNANRSDWDERVSDKNSAESLDGLVNRGPSKRLPVEWMDFHPSSPHFLPKLLVPGFKVAKIMLSHSDVSLYSITHPKEPAYELILERASAVVLGLCDSYAHTLDHVTMFLLNWHVKLSTCIRVPEQCEERTFVRAAEHVPYQAKGFQLNMEDYQSYVWWQRQLFESNEILWAALKHGGLIWQLAVEMKLERFKELILTGPSRRVTQIGGVHCMADGDELWDEMLTEDQIDIICGMYKVEWVEEKSHRHKKAESDHRG
ncbi:hypothetical protein ARMSODRAFT_1026714 [Armillaria solidipes]|uniref:Uncharacterized protein n=1 Tax=Armillaria solidipes TaxID=1076256 RepID=A0A2H3ART4_9AGAR|nr:hypothetical protein ARMSODRAFT_1026714 [Armillaria solidipes]